MKKVIVQFTFQGMSSKLYDKTWEEIRSKGYSHPKGLLHHVGGIQGNNMIVCDVWESQEAFNKFSEILMPIFKNLGIRDAKPVIIPLHYEYIGEGLSLGRKAA